MLFFFFALSFLFLAFLLLFIQALPPLFHSLHEGGDLVATCLLFLYDAKYSFQFFLGKAQFALFHTLHKAGNQAVAVLILRLFLLSLFLLLLLSFKRLLCFDALLLLHVVLADGPLARGLKLHLLHLLGGERLLHDEVVGKEIEHLRHARWYVAR